MPYQPRFVSIEASVTTFAVVKIKIATSRATGSGDGVSYAARSCSGRPPVVKMLEGGLLLPPGPSRQAAPRNKTAMAHAVRSSRFLGVSWRRVGGRSKRPWKHPHVRFGLTNDYHITDSLGTMVLLAEHLVYNLGSFPSLFHSDGIGLVLLVTTPSSPRSSETSRQARSSISKAKGVVWAGMEAFEPLGWS